jgi:hypothetical protein
MKTNAVLQLKWEMIRPTRGAMTRPPTAIPNMAKPMAVPRRLTNHRASTLLAGMKPMPVVPIESSV